MRRYVPVSVTAAAMLLTWGSLIQPPTTILADAVNPFSGTIELEPNRMTKISDRIAFRGGERACIIVHANRDTKADLLLQVIDAATGKVVAEDVKGGHVAAAIWYPNHDGEYQIAIRVNAPRAVKCWVSIK